MVKSSIKTILFLCFLITFINSQTGIQYDHATGHGESKQDNAPQKKSFVVNFDTSKSLPFYLKVTVTPKEGEQTPVLCFSNRDQNCQSNRQAISKRTDGKPGFLFVKKDQISNTDDKLYIQVSCVAAGCSYTLSLDGDQSAVIDINQAYAYLVTSANREMIFEVNGTVEEGAFLNIGFEGSSSATLSVDNVEASQYSFDSGKIMNFPVENKEGAARLAKFTLKNAINICLININIISNINVRC